MDIKKKILVVDDRDNWLKTIKHILMDRYELSLFTNISQAKEAFNRENYDLLILDKNLAGESGLDLLKHFRQSRADLRAIILTEYADIESAVKSMKLGALDYVSKSTADLYNELRSTVEEALVSASVNESAANPIYSLINRGESANLEFKSSLRWDIRADRLNRELEKVIIKTIAAFMNSENESNLLIGVDDNGTVIGIQPDYRTLKKQDRDGFENLLMTLILDSCGKDCAPLIKIAFHEVGGRDLCQVTVKFSPKPMFVKDEKGEHLYVRAGNSTRLLTTREAIEYCKMKWKTPS
jgi:ActR/RegA family two-component response regulator